MIEFRNAGCVLPSCANAKNRVTKITAFESPYDYFHDRYQSYYFDGLRELYSDTGVPIDIERISLSGWPHVLRMLRRIRHSYRLERRLKRYGSGFNRAIDQIADRIGGSKLPPSQLFDSIVGQYIFRLRCGKERLVCVDASDSGDINLDLVAWSDLYFKTNFWPSREYSHKIVPLANGNPLLIGRLDELRALRAMPKEYDLCAVVRIWGGANEVEGIEHNLRLVEALHQAPGRNFVLAYLVAGDIPGITRRLRKQNIATTESPLPLQTLWNISARSRLNFIRLGMHRCVPWRMMDLLAMGGCPVLDQSPRTVWPQPLIENVHFMNLNTGPQENDFVATDDQYAAVPSYIDAALRQGGTAALIAETAARYFDMYLDPVRMAEYMVDMILCDTD